MKVLRILAFVLTVQVSATAMASTTGDGAAAGSGDAALLSLADDFIDNYYFAANPSIATVSGVHRFDDRLEDVSPAGIKKEVDALQGFERRLSAIDPATLSERPAGDRELLLSNVRSSLLTLQVIRPWQSNPDSYSSGIAASAFALAERSFAPANDRLRLLIARERLMPQTLQIARTNLRNPPKVYTEVAIEQLPGIEGFFQKDLPAAFAAADDPELKQQFATVNLQVIEALTAYQAWLQHDVLPHSNGDFRLGAKTFRAKLLYDEMVDIPLDRLLAIGIDNLHQNQAEFARVASRLEPGKDPRAVLAQLALDHPAPDKLLDSFRADFDGVISFLNTHAIITVPAAQPPTLEETPAFMRATTFASMDTPGPFETSAPEAYFNVTLPQADWDENHVAGYMAQFNYPVISNVVVHEAYPGHYVQFLWMHRVDDRVRKLFGASSNAEGWAHYCEQMMLDEGYGQSGSGTDGERATLKLRLGQLQDALLRDARYVVAIQMHTGHMSMNQAIDYFVEQGYQSREVGEVETKRGTSDPTYLYYTLGKLQILKLRADVKARQGDAFQLKSFHDAFMQQGFPPIKVVRHALLQDDSPTL
jgi:uncharacterized protein (DUF885 family)